MVYIQVFVRSGIRFDYVMADAKDTFLKELCEYHISGQLRVAPEHVSDAVLDAMGKPKNVVYENFLKRIFRIRHHIIKTDSRTHKNFLHFRKFPQFS